MTRAVIGVILSDVRLIQLWGRAFFAACALELLSLVASLFGGPAAQIQSFLWAAIPIIGGIGGLLTLTLIALTWLRASQVKRAEQRPRLKTLDSPRDVVEDAFSPLIDAGTARDLVVAVVVGNERFICAFPTRSGESIETRLYEIGSLTKPITSEILASMVADGTVSLDTPLGEVFSSAGLPRDVASITLEELATHRSGLRRLPHSPRLVLSAALGFDPYGWITPEILLRFVSRAKRNAPLGTYSNFGFGVLGMALGERDGGGYARAFRARFAELLGLTDTHVDFHGETIERLARGHDIIGMRMPPWKWSAMVGAGGLRMTIGHGARGLAAQMRTKEVGLAWGSLTVDGATITWHNGGTAGFGSFAAFDRARSVGIIAFAASVHTQAFDRAGFNALRQCAVRWGRQPRDAGEMSL